MAQDQALGLLLRPAPDAPIEGGVVGWSWYGWMHIAFVYLPENLRGAGLGRQLLQRAEAIARENGAVGAILNGPRFWLMSRIAKKPGEPQPTATFGGLDMIEQATVALSSNIPQPYTENLVDRRAVFTFDAGRPVFELVDPDGRRWVMQTFSRIVEKNLTLEDLSALGSRLHPPAGWHYETRTLTEPLVIDTTNAVAHVLQDELTNSYSLES